MIEAKFFTLGTYLYKYNLTVLFVSPSKIAHDKFYIYCPPLLLNEIYAHDFSQLRFISVTRFEGQGRKDEEVRGDEPEKGCLITQNKTVVSKRKQKLRRSSSVVVLLFFGCSALSLSLLITASSLQAVGSLFKSPRQSLESDTGVNHYSLAH